MDTTNKRILVVCTLLLSMSNAALGASSKSGTTQCEANVITQTHDHTLRARQFRARAECFAELATQQHTLTKAHENLASGAKGGQAALAAYSRKIEAKFRAASTEQARVADFEERFAM